MNRASWLGQLVWSVSVSSRGVLLHSFTRIGVLGFMIGEDLHILREQTHCLDILQAYADWEKSREEPTESRWRERLSVEEESAEELGEAWSNAHGLLIAYGWLDIELKGRSIGMQYRITTDGKRALALLNGSLGLDSIEAEDQSETTDADDQFDADNEMAA